MGFEYKTYMFSRTVPGGFAAAGSWGDMIVILTSTKQYVAGGPIGEARTRKMRRIQELINGKWLQCPRPRWGVWWRWRKKREAK